MRVRATEKTPVPRGIQSLAPLGTHRNTHFLCFELLCEIDLAPGLISTQVNGSVIIGTFAKGTGLTVFFAVNL